MMKHLRVNLTRRWKIRALKTVRLVKETEEDKINGKITCGLGLDELPLLNVHITQVHYL